jgi:hypothetical protein
VIFDLERLTTAFQHYVEEISVATRVMRVMVLESVPIRGFPSRSWKSAASLSDELVATVMIRPDGLTDGRHPGNVLADGLAALLGILGGALLAACPGTVAEPDEGRVVEAPGGWLLMPLPVNSQGAPFREAHAAAREGAPKWLLAWKRR